jgi:hypothetical protein
MYPKKKPFLAQSSTLVVCFHPFNIFGKDNFFQITIKYDKNALLSFLVYAYKFLNPIDMQMKKIVVFYCKVLNLQNQCDN